MQSSGMSSKQLIYLMVLFVFGNSAIFGINPTAGRDGWIALLLAVLLAVPFLLVYARILSLFPDRNFFEIIRHVYGKGVGTVLSLLFIWYCLHVSSLPPRTHLEFSSSYTLPNPPYSFFPILLLLASLYLLHSGLNAFGRWSVITFWVVIPVMVLSLIASFKEMQLQNLFPILRRPTEEVVRGTAEMLSFPFLECVVFLPLISAAKKSSDSKQIFLWGIALSAVILLGFFLRNLLLLGEPMLQRLYYPSFTATRLISVGGFLSRLEEIIAIFIILTSLVKIAVCLYGAALGVATLLDLNSINDLLFPLGLLSLALAAFSANSIMDMFNMMKTYPVYAGVFQLCIPLLVWIPAEWKVRREKAPA